MGPKSFVKCLMACESFPFYEAPLGGCLSYLNMVRPFMLRSTRRLNENKSPEPFFFSRNYNGL